MRLRYLLLMLALALTLAACGGEAAKPTVTLVENPWPAAELNAAVAANLLQNELDYTVEVVALDESTQWDAIAGGDADASLEVWPSGHQERIAQYIEEQGVVENAGPLGPVGLIAWYVPTYMVQQNPALAGWEGYADPAVAEQFATAETGDSGAFFAGPPSWTQYDQQIIDNLGLNFQVINTASEEALLAQVAAKYERGEPVLFYFYEPHVVFTRYDLTRVELPAYSDECYARIEQGGVDCAYPGDQLMKIVNPELAAEAPEAYTLLKNMIYTTADQTEMLGYLDSGMSIEEAAQAWLDAHPDVWQAWLP